MNAIVNPTMIATVLTMNTASTPALQPTERTSERPRREGC